MIKLFDIIKEEQAQSILIPRRSKEERSKAYKAILLKRVKTYIDSKQEGDLDLSGAPIDSLPNNLEVRGDLNLAGSSIKELPSGLKVHGYLRIEGTKLKKLPDNLEVGEMIWMSEHKYIKSLPPGLKTKEVYAPDSVLEFVPEDIQVPHELNIYGTKVKSLPDNLKTHWLNIGATEITTLPKGLKVHKLNAASSKLSSLPKDLVVSGELLVINTPLSEKYDEKQIRKIAPGVKGAIGLDY